VDGPDGDVDADLHLGILAGHESALAAWEAKYRPVMCKRARERGLPEIEAENAFEEALHRTMLRANQLLPLGSSLRMFSYKVLSRRIADYHRQHESHEVVDLEQLASHERPLNSVSNRTDEVGGGLSSRLRDCLDRIPERYRLMVEALYVEEMRVDDVALKLGIKPNSVIVARRRVLAQLRGCMEEQHG